MTTADRPLDEAKWKTVLKTSSPRRSRKNGRKRNSSKTSRRTYSSSLLTTKIFINHHHDQETITEEEILSAFNDSMKELKKSDFWGSAQEKLLRLYEESKTRRSGSSSPPSYTLPSYCDKTKSTHQQKQTTTTTKAQVSNEFVQSVVCYGIGNFGTKHLSAPLWQLAFAFAIRDFIVGIDLYDNNKKISDLGDDGGDYDDANVKEKLVSDKNDEDSTRVTNDVVIFYYEPLITQKESLILKRLGVHIIENNERGRRSVDGDCLFYMPHCPMPLYSNLLHTNWNQLRDHTVLIFGNSLSNYTNVSTIEDIDELKRNSVVILKKLEKHCNEGKIPISKRDVIDRPAYFEHAFNDSSLTSFRSTTVTNITWPTRPELLRNDYGNPFSNDDEICKS